MISEEIPLPVCETEITECFFNLFLCTTEGSRQCFVCLCKASAVEMALFLRKLVLPHSRLLSKAAVARNVPSFSTCALRLAKNELDELPEAIDIATGLEKRELLAELAGDPDPFNVKIKKRGAGKL